MVKHFGKKLALLSIVLCVHQGTVPSEECGSILKPAVSIMAPALIGYGALILTTIANGHIQDIQQALEIKLLDEWLHSQNLNIWGDAHDTTYQQGTPLTLNQNRYDFLVEKFPKKPWLKKEKNTFDALDQLYKIVNATGLAALGLGCYASIFAVLALSENIFRYYLDSAYALQIDNLQLDIDNLQQELAHKHFMMF